MDTRTSKETYNICNNKKTYVKDIINKFIEYSGRDNFQVKNIGSEDGDQMGITGDNTKLKKLGWSPKVNINKGLQKFYNYAEETVNRSKKTIIKIVIQSN